MTRYRVTFSFYHDVEAKDAEEARRMAQALSERSKAVLVPALRSEGLGVDAVQSWELLRKLLGREPAYTTATGTPPPYNAPGEGVPFPHPTATRHDVPCPLCNYLLALDGRCYNLNCAIAEKPPTPKLTFDYGAMEARVMAWTEVTYACKLCKRDRFTKPGPHKCGGSYRIRGLEWETIFTPRVIRP